MYIPCLHCDCKKYYEDDCPLLCTYGWDKKELDAYERTGLTPQEIEQLKAENAELKNRLKNSIVLPFKISDRVFVIDKNEVGKYQWYWDKICQIYVYFYDTRIILERCGEISLKANLIFKNFSEAEARLKELEDKQ